MQTQKITGGLFFAAAAIYLTVTGELDIITALAIILCSVCAGLSANVKYAKWAIISGAGLISGSLLLQVIYTRCADYLKADVIILGGVICLAVMEDGKLVKLFRILAGSVAAIIVATFILTTPPVEKSESSLNEPSFLSQEQNSERYMTVSDGQNEVKLGTSEKAVLIFSTECGACKKAVEELIKADPLGEKWTAVQNGEVDQKGWEYLKGQGYKGSIYSFKGYPGAVPVFISPDKSGQTYSTHEVSKMLLNLPG